MKIVLVNKYLYIKGGSERVVFLTKKLLEEAGHEVEVFGMKHEKNIFDNDYCIPKIDYGDMSLGQKLSHLPKSIFNKQAKQQFKQLLQNFQPDVVHFHNIYHQLSFSLIEAAEELHIPMVMTLHDYKMLSPNYNLFHHGKIDDSMLGGKYYRCLLNNCMENMGESVLGTIEAYYRDAKHYREKIAQFISPSYFLKDLCLRAGWNSNTVQVMVNPLEQSTQNSWQEGQYVAFVGRLSSEKGVQVLLEAVQETPHIPYKIAGTGPEEESLKRFVKEKGLHNVEFVGWKSGSEIEDFVRGSRIVLAPSVWYENYPYSILEAKAFGKIVLGSRIGGIPEMLESDCLFNANDHYELVDLVQKWYDTPLEQRQKRGQKLMQEVKVENDPAVYRERILEVYKNVCSK